MAGVVALCVHKCINTPHIVNRACGRLGGGFCGLRAGDSLGISVSLNLRIDHTRVRTFATGAPA